MSKVSDKKLGQFVLSPRMSAYLARGWSLENMNIKQCMKNKYISFIINMF